MAYRIAHHSKEYRERYLSILIQKVDRKTKENYLKKVGLFKEEFVENMSDKELNEQVQIAIKIKGFEI
jgi:hypothetical protein